MSLWDVYGKDGHQLRATVSDMGPLLLARLGDEPFTSDEVNLVLGEMIGELTLAIVAKQKVGILSSTIHPYPTQVEVLHKIGDAYLRARLTPRIKKIFETWLAWWRK